jgi:hypothetical protein
MSQTKLIEGVAYMRALPNHQISSDCPTTLPKLTKPDTRCRDCKAGVVPVGLDPQAHWAAVEWRLPKRKRYERIVRFAERQKIRRNWAALSWAVDELARRDLATGLLRPDQDAARLDAALKRIQGAIAEGAFKWLLWLSPSGLSPSQPFDFVNSVEAEQIGRMETELFRTIVVHMWTRLDMLAALFAKENLYTPKWLAEPVSAPQSIAPPRQVSGVGAPGWRKDLAAMLIEWKAKGRPYIQKQLALARHPPKSPVTVAAVAKAAHASFVRDNRGADGVPKAESIEREHRQVLNELKSMAS